jgi:UV DNA damage endonuclease
MIRFGVCCIWDDDIIATHGTTVTKQLSLGNVKLQQQRTFDMVHHNVSQYLPQSIVRCASLGIYNFRISANIFPCMTHDQCGYQYDCLPSATHQAIQYVRYLARMARVRLTWHHNHFIVPGSASQDIAERSLKEIIAVGKFCLAVGCDAMILHCSGQGEKPEVLQRMTERLMSLPEAVRRLVVLENDHNKFTPRDVYQVCTQAQVRMVYDVHHHRINPDGLTTQDATDMVFQTHAGGNYRNEPLFHLSSPRDGWQCQTHQGVISHSDFIDINDFPQEWMPYLCDVNRHITVEIETKKREHAILQLYRDLADRIKVS